MQTLTIHLCFVASYYINTLSKMKHYILLLVVFTLSVTAVGQTVYESVLTTSKTYNPLFSKESAVISFDLLKTYEIGVDDSVYSFIVSISNVSVEEEGYSSSVGIAFSGGGTALGGGSNVQYSLNKSDETYFMNLDTLGLFISNANRLFVLSRELNQNPNLAVIELGKLRMAVQVNTGFRKAYLFSLGNAVFKFNEDEFKEMLMVAQNAKRIWEKGR